MTLLLRGGVTTLDARLDRLIEFDESSREFAIRQWIDPEAKPKTKTWTVPTGTDILNQGKEGACPGFAITNELLFRPVPITGLGATFAREQIYWPAQRIDKWQGGAYPGASPRYEGTSVLAAVKTAQALGYYGEYRWAFGESDLALSVSNVGPCVLGVNWYAGMMTLDRGGFGYPTGAVQGGHCILCIGYNATHGYYTLYNSWGPTWGVNGRLRVKKADMNTLLQANGEAVVITERFQPTATAVASRAGSSFADVAAETTSVQQTTQ